MTRNVKVTSVKLCTKVKEKKEESATSIHQTTWPTIVFQLMGSTKLLITPANVSAIMLILPTTVGSRFMQASQALHGASLSIRHQQMGQVQRERGSRAYIWGILFELHIFVKYMLVHSAISCNISGNVNEHCIYHSLHTLHSPTEYSFILSLTSRLTVNTNRIAR